ncbi:MAG: UDP-N-acetylmuramoyl-tripeptide--D-alanyl-D-alanine ligase [candidate division WOR-3 bacterium]
MEPLKVEDVVRAVGGTLVRGGRKTITGVSIDSRAMRPGDLFFAIKGERFDGHEFVPDVLARGAAGAIVQVPPVNLPSSVRSRVVIQVADTRKALADLARFYRSRLRTRVVAVTGSNGKTTTREMIAAVLASRHRVVSAEGNFNNDIGVPLTVFRLDSGTEFGVFEIEMNRFGGTRMLAQVCRPEVGVVTNIGDSHLEFMKDRMGVALEKAELLAELPEDGCAVVNADDPMVMNIAGRACRTRCLTFGIEKPADVFATEVRDLGLEGSEFRLMGQHPVRLSIPGWHNVVNFLAACAATRACGMEFADMPRALVRFTPPEKRLRVHRLGKVTLIDDSYNANPQSMAVAVELLCRNAAPGHRVAFLGDMLELGEYAVEAHSRLGQIVSTCLDRVAFVGPLGEHAASVAIKAGMDAKRFRLFADAGQLLSELFDMIRPGDTILVKGSRAMKMELVTQAILQHYDEEPDKVH